MNLKNEEVIVDTNDNIISLKPRGEITKADIYRVSVLWVTNKNNQILLSRRALNKSHDPGRWEPAVAGTIENNETYLENILKEAKEEINLILSEDEVKIGPKLFLHNTSGWQFFCQIFLYQTDKNISYFKLQSEEVMDIKWFDKEQIFNMMITEKNLIVSNMGTIIKAIENFN